MQVWALRAGILASCGSLDLHYAIFRKDEESIQETAQYVAKKYL